MHVSFVAPRVRLFDMGYFSTLDQRIRVFILYIANNCIYYFPVATHGHLTRVRTFSHVCSHDQIAHKTYACCIYTPCV